MNTKHSRMEPAMNATATSVTANRSLRHKPVILIAISAILAAIAVAYTVGYRVGVAKQEKRLLNEFLVNAANLGIIDYNRLRELTEDVGTNTENRSASANGQGGEP